MVQFAWPCCSSTWACSCWGSFHGSERAGGTGRAGTGSSHQGWHLRYPCKLLGQAHKAPLVREFWSFSSELTGVQGAAPSHAISQLSLPLKFQIGRGIKWLNTSCRTSIFFFSPKASSTLFYKLWFSITARTTLAKSSTFDSFYLDVDMWFLYS